MSLLIFENYAEGNWIKSKNPNQTLYNAINGDAIFLAGSDDLNFEKADLLEKEFGDVFNTVFGIGTFCLNDTGNKPVSVVMKMVRMNGIDVIKVSDTEGKIMCENQEVIEKTKLFIKNRLNKGA